MFGVLAVGLLLLQQESNLHILVAEIVGGIMQNRRQRRRLTHCLAVTCHLTSSGHLYHGSLPGIRHFFKEKDCFFLPSTSSRRL